MPETNPDDPAKLREKLDKALKENKKLSSQLAIHEGGMSHLNEHQRRALVAQIGDNEMSKEALVQAAKDLGFPAEPAQPKPTDQPSGDPTANNGNANSDGSSNQDSNPDPTPDPSVAESLEQLDDMERAHIMQMRRERGVSVTTDQFDKAIAEAKDAAEVERIVETMGPSVGIMSDKNIY